MNLRDLAKALGLSPATVSVCLSGDPQKTKLSKKTVERVRKFADEAGYVPNRYARKIFYPGKDRTVGIIFKFDSALVRYTPVLLSAMHRLDQAGIEYVVQTCEHKNIVPTIRLLLGMRIHQILIIGFLYESDLAGAEKFKHVELYPLDLVRTGEPENPDLPIRCRMGADQDDFFVQLARRILDAGMGPIAVDCNIPVLHAAGLVPAENILDHPYSGDNFEIGIGLAARVIELYRRKQCRTVMLRNDSTAAGLISALLKRKIRIPGQISLIGYNDADFTPYTAVPLTTIHVPMQENLDLALDHLIDGKPLPDRVTNPLRLVERSSFVFPVSAPSKKT